MRTSRGIRCIWETASGVYGAPIVAENVTSYVARNLIIGNAYYFSVTSYDTGANESVYSTEVGNSIY